MPGLPGDPRLDGLFAGNLHPTVAHNTTRFKLPEALASAGDPVEGNPFRSGSSRHDEWARATRRAEERHARILAEWLEPRAARLRLDDPFGLLVQKFEIWAQRGVHVVWSDAELDSFSRWLVSYSNALLEAAATQTDRYPVFVRESDVVELRNRLAGRVAYWCAEARAYRRKQIEASVHPPTGGPVPGSTREATPSAPSAQLIERRRRLIKDYKSQNGLSWKGFARSLGMSETAVRGIVKEDRSRFSPEKRDLLLRKLGITPSDWDAI